MSDALQEQGPLPASEAAWRIHLAEGADLSGLRGSLADGSLTEAFHATAVRVPSRPALEIDGERVTHGELDAAAATAAGKLLEDGVGRGEPVLLAASNSLATVIAYMAVLRVGAVVVLANPRLTEHELGHIVEHSGVRRALADGEAREELAKVARRLPRLRVHPMADYHSAAQDAGVRPVAVQPQDPDDVAVLSYTSGTTGRPKAVPLTHANLLASTRAVMLAWRWDEDDILVHSLPVSHQHGLGGIHATLLAGSRAVILAQFDPAALHGALADNRASVLFAVPAIYERLADHLEAEGGTLRWLRLLISGSAPLSPALAARVEHLAGQLPLERYGTTESGLDVSNPYDGPRVAGSVGVPLPGIEMAVVDAGQRVPDGTDGEIVVRGPQVFRGYRGDETATADAFLPGGWFRTGDVGCVDPGSGYLRITGRLKDLIITGGMNVYPREVELVLEESPLVSMAAVVGMPSRRWGEEVVACVVPAGDELDVEDLLAFAGERLAPYKRPKRVVTSRTIPMNAMGKILRDEVAELIGS